MLTDAFVITVVIVVFAALTAAALTAALRTGAIRVLGSGGYGLLRLRNGRLNVRGRGSGIGHLFRAALQRVALGHALQQPLFGIGRHG